MDSAMHGRRLAATLRHLCARSCAGGGDAEAAVETETKEEGFRWVASKDEAAENFCMFNGETMKESEVRLSRQDADGFIHGCFDTTRTFNGAPFALEEHVARLFRTMKHLGITSPYTAAEYIAMNKAVLEQNKAMVAEADCWITTKVCPVGFHPEVGGAANVLIAVDPIPFAGRRAQFRHGIQVQVSSVRRAAPEAMSPRVKANANYSNLMMAEREVQSGNPLLAQIQLDHEGNLCEGNGANLFLVHGGKVRTPRGRMVLEGVSRGVCIKLCAQLGIPFEEDDMDVYDAYTADEAFITSTSWCICGVRTFNGRQIGESTEASPHGPITRRLMDAYVELVQCDFVKQYTDAH